MLSPRVLALQNNHDCVINNLQQPCPVCSEVLFDSVKPLTVLSCGHAMHRDCHHHLLDIHFPVCMLCMRSPADCAATRLLVLKAAERLHELRKPHEVCAGVQDADEGCLECEPSLIAETGHRKGEGNLSCDGEDRDTCAVMPKAFCVFCRRRTEAVPHVFGQLCATCGGFCS
jgi:hypothetical protein